MRLKLAVKVSDISLFGLPATRFELVTLRV